jgi:hypothetical protein
MDSRLHQAFDKYMESACLAPTPQSSPCAKVIAAIRALPATGAASLSIPLEPQALALIAIVNESQTLNAESLPLPISAEPKLRFSTISLDN